MPAPAAGESFRRISAQGCGMPNRTSLRAAIGIGDAQSTRLIRDPLPFSPCEKPHKPDDKPDEESLDKQKTLVEIADMTDRVP
jgi:hypothetical protein